MTQPLLRLAPFVVLPWTWFVVRDLHPAADVVALGMPVLVTAAVVVCAFAALVRRSAGPLAAGASWVLFGLAVIVGPWTPRPGPVPVDAVRVVAANTLGSVPYPPSIGADIAAQAPDVLVVSELSDGIAADFGARFASTHLSAPGPSGRPDVAVFSDLRVAQLEMPDGLQDYGVRVRVHSPSGSFVLYGLHLPPPRAQPDKYPDVSVRAHRDIVRAVRDAVKAEDGPVVVAGDLNLVDRTSGYRMLTGVLDDAMRSDWVRPTAGRKVIVPLLGRVDHVFVSESWCSAASTVFDLPGSDHEGVAADVGPCP